MMIILNGRIWVEPLILVSIQRILKLKLRFNLFAIAAGSCTFMGHYSAMYLITTVLRSRWIALRSNRIILGR